MEKIREFLAGHKTGLISCVCGLVAGAVAALALLSAILFGYYQLSPQDSIGVTINRTEINGTKEDGGPITGFIIELDDGSSYLVTDYFSPIYLSEGEQ